MSAQLKSFEGPDVQLLLDGIRQELGPGAKIDRAERIRVGGVLGFFAKEHYRVVVEVPGTDDTDLPVTDASPAAEGRSRRARRTSPADPPSASPPGPTGAAEGDVFRAMAEATDDVNEIAAPAVAAPAAALPPLAAPPVPAPVAETFDAVLTRVATTLGPSPAETVAPGTGTAHPGPSPAGGQPPDTGDPLPAADVATGAATFLAENGPGSNGAVPLLPAATTAAPAAPTVAPAVGPADDAMSVALHRVGLDDALVATMREGRRRGQDLETLLLAVFAEMPVAPPLPRRPGSLLVVVGDGVAARRLGCALAGEIGMDPADVPFASRDVHAHTVATGRLLLRSAEEAAERAPGWRRSRAAVVVVDAGVTGAERSWATHLIAALRPTGVWGVVEATAKVEDISAWAQNLGGIDALALEHLDATVSPVAALGAGLPVARIDGQPSTAARWVATVMDRVIPCR